MEEKYIKVTKFVLKSTFMFKKLSVGSFIYLFIFPSFVTVCESFSLLVLIWDIMSQTQIIRWHLGDKWPGVGSRKVRGLLHFVTSICWCRNTGRLWLTQFAASEVQWSKNPPFTSALRLARLSVSPVKLSERNMPAVTSQAFVPGAAQYQSGTYERTNYLSLISVLLSRSIGEEK